MKTNREGFTLVEVLVSVVLLAVLLTMLGGLTFSTARQSVSTGSASARQAASLELVNQLSTLPFNMLTLGTRCDTAFTAHDNFRRCATITQNGGGRDIVVTTTPLIHNAPASVVRFTRANPVPPQNPLCTLGPC
jgi:prepilin-type N-terminal cleavage/methylation domain-containing protein